MKIVNFLKYTIQFLHFHLIEPDSVFYAEDTANEDRIILSDIFIWTIDLKQLSKLSLRCLFQEFCVWKIFCKLLSKHLCWNLFLVKCLAFSIFFGVPLDGCVWTMKIVIWDPSYFVHSNNFQNTKALFQNLL